MSTETTTTQTTAGDPEAAPEDVRAFLDAVYTAVDAQDAEAFAGFFAEEGRLRFGNWDPLTGPQAVEAAIDEFFESVAGLSHDIRRIWTPADGHVGIEAVATYTRHDGDDVEVPAAVRFELEGEAIQDMRVYVDQGPVFE